MAMVTYAILSVLVIVLSAFGVTSLLKERRHKRKQIRMAEA